MISVIITSKNESATIKKAIESIEKNEFGDNFEVLIGAPDKETLDSAGELKSKYKNIVLVQDKVQRGKPSALNDLVKKAKGEILILTDGDVYIEREAIKNLLKQFKDYKIGAVSGRPVSMDDRNTKYGFWGYTLSEIANIRRIRAVKKDLRFFCSGYLFAIRKELFPNLMEELLSEDGYISQTVYNKGYKIGYSPEAKVYVKYPNNFTDWVNQKKRSVGGYTQIKKLVGIKIKSVKSEFFGGFEMLRFVNSFSSLIWLIELAFARIYLWILIHRDISVKKKTREELWTEIKSTK